MFKKFICWLRGHKLVLEVQILGGSFTAVPKRLRCKRCGKADPYFKS